MGCCPEQARCIGKHLPEIALVLIVQYYADINKAGESESSNTEMVVM